jgi:hypothetical protein
MGFENSAGLGVNNHYGPRPILDGAGRLKTEGDKNEVRLKVTGVDLDDVGTAIPDFVVPAGSYIESVTFYVSTAFVGATAVLDIGSVANDDGWLTTAVTNIDADDDRVVASAEAFLNTTLAADAEVIASYDTAAFTAGEGELVIVYRDAI